MTEPLKHILVAGGGLSGLITATKLLRKGGVTVTLVEKNARLGGLCGTFNYDGEDYVIGCNDFGSGMAKVFQSLGVNQRFISLKSKVYYNGKFYDAQIGAQTFFELLSDWKNCCTLGVGILRRQFEKSSTSLEAFVDSWTKPGLVNDYAKLVSYFMGVRPCELSTSFFAIEGKYNYGYTKMICPVGGPQTMVDNLTKTINDLGGRILLNTKVTSLREEGDQIQVKVLNQQSGDSYELPPFDKLVNTTGARELYPEGVKEGMKLSSMCICISANFQFPENVHTLTYYPPGVSDWFADLDSGKQPEDFGFHIFNSRLAKYYDNQQLKGDRYTANIYFYTPRGVESIDKDKQAFYERHIFSKLELMLPGIGQAILSSRIFAPQEYHEIHGVCSSVMPFITNEEKPRNKQGDSVFYAGHHVYPPGDHAGATARSAMLVADEIH